MRLFIDTELDAGGALEFALNPEEAGVLFVVEGEVDVTVDGVADPRPAAATHTVVWQPDGIPRKVELRARQAARVLHVITGPGDPTPDRTP